MKKTPDYRSAEMPTVLEDQSQLKELFGLSPKEEVEELPQSNRRRFLEKAMVLLGAGVVSMSALVTQGLAAVKENPADPGDNFLDDVPSFSEAELENVIIRMQTELQRAMKKPMKERSWVMVIDLRKCTGCMACTISCIAENHLPPAVVYRPVIEEEIGTYPNVSMRSIPRPCMQCEDAPCVPVCPVKATWIREDGIVDMDYDQCIGCKYCMTACPYHARTFDFGYNYTDGTPSPIQPYEEIGNFEYGKRWDREKKSSPVGNVRKCHFCTHKLDAGMLPSCVTTCIGYATYFGDINDPESLVSELISRPNTMRLKEELGTKPRVWYLV